MTRLLIIVACALSVVLTAVAQTPDIIDHITRDGNTVSQPAALRSLLRVSTPAGGDRAETSAEPVTGYGTGVRTAGFRVQVFSDNNRQTAKGEARSKARRIQNAFPHYRTYVVYTSPYWRLKVGDFATRGEAESAAEEIRSAFPAYAKEVRVVRDNINGSNR